MRNGKKWAAAASILMVTCALTSCTMPRAINDIMGEERYLPDGSTQTFGTPRRPILNPLHNAPRALDRDDGDHSYSASADRALTASNAPAASSSGAKRRVPSENAAILSGNSAPAPATMAMTPPVTSVDEALAQKTVATAPAPAVNAAPAMAAAPVEAAPASTETGQPLTLMKPSSERPATMTADAPAAVEQPVAVPASEEVPAAITSAPAAEPAAAPADWSAPQQPAVTTEAPAEGVIRLVPPSAPKPGEASSSDEQSSMATPMPVAMVAPAETNEIAVQTKPAVDATASAPVDAAPTSYPSLASIPDAPEATPAKQIASDIRSLEEERKDSQNANQQLMNDPNSTVLTSPKTGELVSNAAEAMPSMAPAAGTPAPAAKASESTWLNNLLGPADTKAEEAKQAEEERKAAETVAAALKAEPALQQQDLTVPPVAAANPTTTTTTSEPSSSIAAAPSVLDQLKPAASETTAPATAAAANETAAIVAAANAEQAVPAAATAAGAEPAATMDTVKLTPPVNVAEATAVKADKELSDIVEQPVEEVQPLPVKKVEYLPESRYAKRRLAPVNEAY